MMDKPRQQNRIENQNPPEFHLALVNRHIRDMMSDCLRPYGMKLVEWRVMSCLMEAGVMPILDLAALAVIDRTVASRLVDRMVEKAWVARNPMPGDRRYSNITLTQAGRKQMARVEKSVERARAGLFNGLSQGELAQLLTLLQRLSDNACRTRDLPKD